MCQAQVCCSCSTRLLRFCGILLLILLLLLLELLLLLLLLFRMMRTHDDVDGAQRDVLRIQILNIVFMVQTPFCCTYQVLMTFYRRDITSPKIAHNVDALFGSSYGCIASRFVSCLGTSCSCISRRSSSKPRRRCLYRLLETARRCVQN